MEHIIITEINENTVKLMAESGYVLTHKITGNAYSEAIVSRKNAGNFVAKER